MDAFARRFRWLVVVVALLSIGASVVGTLPGSRVYEDANHCLGLGLGGLFRVDYHPPACAPSYTELVAEHPAGGVVLAGALALLLVPGIAGCLRPRRLFAYLWPVWLVVVEIALFWWTFDLPLFERVVHLWPQEVVDAALVAIALLVGIASPTVALLSRRSSAPADPP